MKKLSKEEKIKILKKAKRFVKKGVCICDAIYESTNCEITYHDTLKYFPELRKFRPKGKKVGDLWFGDFEIEPRIITINKVIRELGGKP